MENLPVVAEDEKPAEEQVNTAVESEAQAEEQTEKSVYEQELERIKAEKEKAELISRQKEGALKEEREKRKAAEKAAEALAESKKDSLSVEEVDRRLDERLARRDMETFIGQVTSDPNEQALIRHHYDTSIVKTGDVKTDITRAAAIANAHLVDQAKQAQAEREQQEGLVANYQMGSPMSRPGKPNHQTDPVLRAAGSILDRLGVPDAKKYLGK